MENSLRQIWRKTDEAGLILETSTIENFGENWGHRMEELFNIYIKIIQLPAIRTFWSYWTLQTVFFENRSNFESVPENWFPTGMSMHNSMILCRVKIPWKRRLSQITVKGYRYLTTPNVKIYSQWLYESVMLLLLINNGDAHIAVKSRRLIICELTHFRSRARTVY